VTLVDMLRKLFYGLCHQLNLLYTHAAKVTVRPKP
jgi:hypothetical protein